VCPLPTILDPVSFLGENLMSFEVRMGLTEAVLTLFY